MSAYVTRTQMMDAREAAMEGSDDDDRVIVAKFRESLTTNQEQLSEFIDPSHGLWSALSDRKVLPDRVLNACKAEKTDEDRVEALINKLKRVEESEKVLLFYEALRSNHQEHIVKKYFPAAAGSSFR